MKKIIIAMAAIAAAFTMASCNKELVNPNENPTVGKSVITASIENDVTKTTLEGDDTKGYKVFWSAGDQLLVADNEGSDWCAKYTLDDSSADSSTGTFSWKNGDFFFQFGDYDEPAFEEGTEYMALYPFDLYDLDDEGAPAYGLTWKTEQRYSETDRYIPMYSETVCTKDGDAEFKFANIGGLLRLTVKGTAKIRSIELRAAETMSGIVEYISYKSGYIMFITDDTHGGIHYVTLDCGKDGVELNVEEGTDFYFSLPCCFDTKKWEIDGYSDVTITLTDTDGKTCVKKLNNKKLFIERSKITTATFTASEFKSNVPEGALPGKFSVSANKQVYFSQGNLYYDESQYLDESEQRIVTVGFCFETNQYDYQVTRTPKHVSYFYWSTNPEHAAKGYDTTGSTSSGDVIFSNDTESMPKRNFTVNGVTGQFRTLSKDEWSYLFNHHSYKWVTVNGVKGYAIAPDGFDGTIADTYADNAALATDNLLFLPAAGGEIEGLDDRYTEENGFYWSSSSKSEKEAYGVWFHSSGVTTNYPEKRSSGYCVRLVKDC